VNTSELVAKVTEVHSVSRRKRRGCGQHAEEPPLCPRRNGGRPFKMTTAKLRLAPAGHSARGEKIKIAASRKLTSSPARA